ncbi:DNA/RNA polymerase, partial [Macrolepiota fuliginosa MF-IS2]
YLDDLLVTTTTLQEHIEIAVLAIDILEEAKFYISKEKMKFLQNMVKVLGRVITDDGITMDPDKIDTLSKWKVPTNWDLLCSFLGAASFLTDDVA